MSDTETTNGSTEAVTGVPFTLNGSQAYAHEGELLIEAAERHGVHIPRFCHHKRMEPVGMCRMCLVDVDAGRGPGLQPSCMVPVTPDMVVDTESPNSVSAQDGVLELLLANHPLDCPVCDKGGECPLQDNAYAFGPGESRFVEEKRHYEKPIPISDLVYLDRERCILCDRCTRFADEVAGDPLIHFIDRGSATQVNTFPDDPFSSYFSGNTVQICPVGALTASPYRFKARPWDLSAAESTATVDAVGSRVVLQSSRREIVRILGVDSDAVNWGWLSDKERFSYEAAKSADRITEPQIQTEDGDFVSARWSEATDRFVEAIADVDPRRIAVIGGARLSLESQYAWAKLVKSVIKTDNVDCQLGDGLPGPMALGLPRTTIDGACTPGGVVVLLGADPKEVAPTLYLRLRHAIRHDNVTLVEITPRPSGLAHLATASLHPVPGNVGAVLSAVAGESGSDHGAGVPAEQLQQVRDLLTAGGRPVTVVVGRGNLAESPRYAADAVGTLQSLVPDARFLPMLRRGNVLGALEMGLSPGFLPGGVRRGGGTVDGWEELPQFDGRDTDGILRAAASEKIDTLILLGADPLNDFAYRSHVEEAFANIKNIVAVDTFLTASSKRASVILPAAMSGEHDGTFMNLEGRLSPLRAKVPVPGQVRPDWMIAAGIMNRLGPPSSFRTLVELRQEMAAAVGSLRDVSWNEVDDGADGPLASLERNWVLEFDDPVPPPSSTSTGLRLMVDNKLWDNGTMVTQSDSLSGLVEDAVLRLSPSDARRLNLTEADTAEVDREGVSVSVPVAVEANLPAGVAWMSIRANGFDARELISTDRTVTNLQIRAGRGGQE